MFKGWLFFRNPQDLMPLQEMPPNTAALAYMEHMYGKLEHGDQEEPEPEYPMNGPCC